MAVAGLPADQAVLAAVGAVALRHGQLDNSFKLLIGDLAGISKEEALHATAMQGSRELRDRAKRLAKQRFGDGPALVKLDAIIQRARLLSEDRNDLLHSTWGLENGVPVVRDSSQQFQPAPTAIHLLNLANKISVLVHELSAARINGFLHVAMQEKPLKIGDAE